MFNSTLLSQVERKLNITWNDEETTKRLTEIIEKSQYKPLVNVKYKIKK